MLFGKPFYRCTYMKYINAHKYIITKLNDSLVMIRFKRVYRLVQRFSKNLEMSWNWRLIDLQEALQNLTAPMVGLDDSSSWTHQQATMQALSSSSKLTSLLKSASNNAFKSPSWILFFATSIGKNLSMHPFPCSAFFFFFAARWSQDSNNIIP